MKIQEDTDMEKMDKTTKKITTKKVIQGPTEGRWFDVNPLEIDQTLFQQKRNDWKQEPIRKLILQAFDAVNKNPEKYGRKFKTMMPYKNWCSKTPKELEQLACELGDHNADLVEQALEWAQRIYNGESWQTVCNNRDTAKWARLITSQGGYLYVGGWLSESYGYPASFINELYFLFFHTTNTAVPLVVLYEKYETAEESCDTAKDSQRPTEDQCKTTEKVAIAKSSQGLTENKCETTETIATSKITQSFAKDQSKTIKKVTSSKTSQRITGDKCESTETVATSEITQSPGKDQSKTIKKVAKRPVKGKWFDVNPLEIDQTLFQEQGDVPYMTTRRLILCAFDEVKKNPKKYGRNFQTMMPEIIIETSNTTEVVKYCSNKGHLADWVEQALEWAQRIYNGESWKTLCNTPDTASCHRLVNWSSYYALVGGASAAGNKLPPCFHDILLGDEILHYVVPLIVRYKK